MERRDFLKATLGAAIAAGGNVFRFPFTPKARAQTAALPTLVVIFQRGGCDGLNAVVPFGDPDYYGLRPTIGVPEPNAADPTSALLLNDASGVHGDFFGLHPSLAPLLPIYDAGDLAVLPTVQYASPSHSHFDGQNFIESGAPVRGLDGWLNRRLSVAGAMGQLQAVHFGGELSQALRGSIPVQSFSFIDSFALGLGTADDALVTDTVLPVYADAPSPATAYQQLVHDYGQVLFGNLSVANAIDTSSYTPANGAFYPSGSYGRRLRETAQLIKEGVDLELVTVDIGGWDTHSGQGGGEADGRQARRFAELAGGIAALYTDLGELMDNVVVLTMTEFGRTAKENGSAGTDHGEGSSWFMVGRNVNGGIYGDWPGLSEENLASGRYLQYTVDYRDVMGDVLTNHLGHAEVDLASILPGHGYAPLNLFG